MLRTCSWGGISTHAWQPTSLGGNDVYRQCRSYAADRQRSRTNVQDCTKHQRSNMCLLPGIMLYWCTTCRKCIFFYVMSQAESPR